MAWWRLASPEPGLEAPCPGAMVGEGEMAVGGEGGGDTPPAGERNAG